ncbi:MAG: SDR family oxidoreductase [Candidatus Brocadiia bacterium]|jgi:NAD(P)-dependent dehydrogenase (short-subunit alcohol dehydrogenase family)|nr:SDR family oxidoreductase [Candidatus Brocadiia bacterium]
MVAGEIEVDLAGEVVVITGGAGVLCGTMAEALAARGAAVAVLDIDAEAAEARAGSIRRAGGSALAVRASVLERADLERGAKLLKESLGHPTVLVNGAGGNRPEATTGPDRALFDLPADAVRGVFDLNFLGTFLASQVFGRMMVEGDGGSIINIASMAGSRPLTKIPAYSAAKAAVSNFTRWLAVHMSHNCGGKVRVNAIAPGFLLTQQNRFLLIDRETGELTARGRQIVDHTPMGRFGEPEELLGTLLWLLSDSAKFVHGIVVPVDGGFSAYSGV